jgi:hypothetical protein
MIEHPGIEKLISDGRSGIEAPPRSRQITPETLSANRGDPEPKQAHSNEHSDMKNSGIVEYISHYHILPKSNPVQRQSPP